MRSLGSLLSSLGRKLRLREQLAAFEDDLCSEVGTVGHEVCCQVPGLAPGMAGHMERLARASTQRQRAKRHRRWETEVRQAPKGSKGSRP